MDETTNVGGPNCDGDISKILTKKGKKSKPRMQQSKVRVIASTTNKMRQKNMSGKTDKQRLLNLNDSHNVSMDLRTSPKQGFYVRQSSKTFKTDENNLPSPAPGAFVRISDSPVSKKKDSPKKSYHPKNPDVHSKDSVAPNRMLRVEPANVTTGIENIVGASKKKKKSTSKTNGEESIRSDTTDSKAPNENTNVQNCSDDDFVECSQPSSSSETNKLSKKLKVKKKASFKNNTEQPEVVTLESPTLPSIHKEDSILNSISDDLNNDATDSARKSGLVDQAVANNSSPVSPVKHNKSLKKRKSDKNVDPENSTTDREVVQPEIVDLELQSPAKRKKDRRSSLDIVSNVTTASAMKSGPEDQDFANDFSPKSPVKLEKSLKKRNNEKKINPQNNSTEIVQSEIVDIKSQAPTKLKKDRKSSFDTISKSLNNDATDTTIKSGLEDQDIANNSSSKCPDTEQVIATSTEGLSCVEITTDRPKTKLKRKGESDASNISPKKNKLAGSFKCSYESQESGSKETNEEGNESYNIVDSDDEVSKRTNNSKSGKNVNEIAMPLWLETSSDSDTANDGSKGKGEENKSANETNKIRLGGTPKQLAPGNIKKKSKNPISQIPINSDNEDGEDREQDRELWKFHKWSNTRQVNLTEEARDVEEMLELLEEEDQLPEETIDKLRTLVVKLRHTVQPQHQIESFAGTHALTPEQKAMFQKIGPVKNGKFTPEEDNTIVDNWKAFCRLHHWDSRDVKPFLYMRHKGNVYYFKFEERQKFVQFLADGLPWRTLYSVYCRFRNLYQSRLQSRYKPEEDKLIIAHMGNCTADDMKRLPKFSELAKILNRTRASVWRRYRLLKKKREIQEDRVEWTALLIEKLLENLLQLMCSKDLCELKNAFIPKVVWNELEDRLDISAKILKEFWDRRLHMQLFCSEDIYSNDIKMKLIEYIYTMGISDLEEVIWSNVAKEFNGATSIFLYKIFSHMIDSVVAKLHTRAFDEIIEYLYHEELPKLKKLATDKCLSRISYENGKVNILDTRKGHRKQED